MKFRIADMGQEHTWPASRHEQFLSDTFMWTPPATAQFFLDGVPCSFEDLQKAASELRDQKLNKKSETHKQIRVFTGIGDSRCADDSMFKTVWVRK